MNLQQKVIQFTSKMKEKETQQAAEDSSVSQYDEIKDSLSEQQKDLIFTCYSKLTPLGYQKEEDAYNICKRFDFNEKVLNDYISVLLKKASESSSDYGDWVEVTSKAKGVVKDEKGKSTDQAITDKDDNGAISSSKKYKGRESGYAGRGRSTRGYGKANYQDDYDENYEDKSYTKQGEYSNKYRRSERNYDKMSKSYDPRAFGRDDRDQDNFYYEDAEYSENYYDDQNNTNYKYNQRYNDEASRRDYDQNRRNPAKNSNRNNKKHFVSYVAKEESTTKDPNFGEEKPLPLQEKTRTAGRNNYVYYVKKEETQQKPDQTQQVSNSPPQTKQGQENAANIPKNTYEEPKLHYSGANIDEFFNKADRNSTLESNVGKATLYHDNSKENHEKDLKREHKNDTDKQYQTNQAYKSQDSQQQQHQKNNNGLQPQYTQKASTNHNQADQQQTLQTTPQQQPSSSPNKAETRDTKLEEQEEFTKMPAKYRSSSPAQNQMNAQAQTGPTAQSQPVGHSQVPPMAHPFAYPYIPFIPHHNIAQTENKDVPPIFQMPYIVIPQSNGTSIIQPLYNFYGYPPQAPANQNPNQTNANQPQHKQNTQFTPDPYQYTRSHPFFNSNDPQEVPMSKSRSTPGQTQPGYFQFADKSNENNSSKPAQNTQQLYGNFQSTNQAGHAYHQPYYYPQSYAHDPTASQQVFNKPNNGNTKQ